MYFCFKSLFNKEINNEGLQRNIFGCYAIVNFQLTLKHASKCFLHIPWYFSSSEVSLQSAPAPAPLSDFVAHRSKGFAHPCVNLLASDTVDLKYVKCYQICQTAHLPVFIWYYSCWMINIKKRSIVMAQSRCIGWLKESFKTVISVVRAEKLQEWLIYMNASY